MDGGVCIIVDAPDCVTGVAAGITTSDISDFVSDRTTHMIAAAAMMMMIATNRMVFVVIVKIIIRGNNYSMNLL